MNGSTLSVRLGMFGVAAVLALGVGCQKSAMPAKAQAKPTPPFESSVPEAQTGTQVGQGQVGQGQVGQGQVGQGQVGQGQMGMGQAEQGQAGTMQGHGTMNEREMCSSLTEHGSLHAENIDGGVALVASPVSGAEPTTLRNDALHVAYALSPPAGQQAEVRPKEASDRCPLFDLGTLTTHSSVVEQGNDVRILLIAKDPADVATLRTQARAFIQTWGKNKPQR